MKVRLGKHIKLFFCIALVATTPFLTARATTKDESIQSLISKMSDEEKVGQVIMSGFMDQSLTPALKKHLLDIKPGFLILFKRNISSPSQTLKLVYAIENAFINKKVTVPLLTVDQEGGDVVRIPTSPPIPTALALGELKEPALAKKLGRNIGRILNEFHIFMNLAPVLDLTEYSPTSFIQTRSFGSDPKEVTDVARAFIEGLEDYRVISTAKHFPGIGYTSNDSHKSISFADLTEEELVKSLEPYRVLIKASKLDAVMMTHHIYKNIDSLPATFSPKIIKILRSKFGFKGIILTDDIEMIGAKIFKTPEQRAVEAFLAGNDVVMVAWNKSSQKKAHQGLLKAYKEGVISKERLNQSLERILATKLKTPAFEEKNQNDKIKLQDALLTLKNDELKSTIDEILVKKIEQEYEALIHTHEFPKDQKRYLILSGDHKFIKEFKNNSTDPVRSVYLSHSTQKVNFKVRSNELVIFYINGPKTTSVFKSLINKLPADQLLVVNSRFRSLVETGNAPVLHVQMKHPGLGRQIAELFSKNKARLPTNINSGF